MLQFDTFEVLTFDCYGTLIDWETGIWAALHPIFASHKVEMAQDEALALYGELESAAEHGEYRDYRDRIGKGPRRVRQVVRLCTNSD